MNQKRNLNKPTRYASNIVNVSHMDYYPWSIFLLLVLLLVLKYNTKKVKKKLRVEYFTTIKFMCILNLFHVIKQ